MSSDSQPTINDECFKNCVTHGRQMSQGEVRKLSYMDIYQFLLIFLLFKLYNVQPLKIQKKLCDLTSPQSPQLSTPFKESSFFKSSIINHEMLPSDDNKRNPIFKALQNVYHRLSTACVTICYFSSSPKCAIFSFFSLSFYVTWKLL